MKQVIRNNTFETNSSSMHSLVVTKEAKPYNNEDKNFNLYNKKFDLFLYEHGDFSRTPFEVLATPKDKLRYYVAHYVGFLKDKSKIKYIKTFLSKYLHIDKKDICLNYTDEYDNKKCYGYAGCNDSGEDVFTCLENHNISMEEFLLDPRYTVIIDGDEYCELVRLFDKNIINTNNIDYISSGIDFWSKSKKVYNFYYINRCDDDNVYADLITSIEDFKDNKFIKEIIIEDDNIENLSFDAMLNFSVFLKAVKEINPNIKFILKYNYHNINKFNEILDYMDEIIDERNK